MVGAASAARPVRDAHLVAMKFGKYIRTVAFAPWADKYVDYKLLKKHLKPFEDGVATQQHEDVFLAGLHAEINKVGSVSARACAVLALIPLFLLIPPFLLVPRRLTHFSTQRRWSCSSCCVNMPPWCPHPPMHAESDVHSASCAVECMHRTE